MRRSLDQVLQPCSENFSLACRFSGFVTECSDVSDVSRRTESKMKLFGLLLIATMLTNAQSSPDTLVNQYFDQYFQLTPSEAPAAVFTEHDSELEDYRAAGFSNRIAMNRRFLVQFQALPQSDNRDLMIARIEAQILSDEKIRGWETNPDFYSGSITSSIFGLMSLISRPRKNGSNLWLPERI